MKVVLRVHIVDFVALPGDWWRQDPGLLARSWRCLAGQGLLDQLRYCTPPGRRRSTALAGLDALVEASAGWKDGHGWLSATPERTRDCFLDVDLRAGAMGLTLGFGAEYLERQRHSLLDQYVNAVRCLHRELHAVALFGPMLRVEVLDLPYARPRPPRLHQHFGHGDLVDFFCLDFHRRHPLGRLAEVERLLAAPLPEGATRQDDDDLVILRWARDLEDRSEIARRRSVQDQWLTGILVPPVQPQFDEHGDERILTFAPPRDASLTYYDTDAGAGYLQVPAASDGSADAARLDEALGWLAAGSLPDGRSLNALYVIAPDRATALRIAPRAQEDGAAGVYYVGQDGNWWDPFPPGPWIEEGGQR